MTNYENMDDFQINTLVAVRKFKRGSIMRDTENGSAGCIFVDGKHVITVDYCNDPRDAFSIITGNYICLDYNDGFGWSAESRFTTHEHTCHDNPLRAAMIVFLMMTKGA